MTLSCIIHILAIIAIIMFAFHETKTLSLEEELTLTPPQKEILNEFKEDVFPLLTHKYMKQEIYLIKWLRAGYFDIKNSKKLLMDNLKWRKENKIDDILDEDFSLFETEFPFWLDGKDFEGRPVGSADVSLWDPRPPVVAGKTEKLFRFMLRSTELASKIIRDDQIAGKNITQCTLVANLDGFNLIQHTCSTCISLYFRYFMAFQNYYPGLVHKLFMVNTPAAFDVLLTIIWPILTQDVRDFLNIQGSNKKQWQREVLKVIPADQIRSQFGGTLPSDYD